MATATPMQIDWIEVFDFLRLVNRVGPFQSDPSLTWCYYEELGALVREERVSADQWALLRKSITLLERHDPFFNEFLQEAVMDGRIQPAAPLSRVMLRHTRPLLEIYRERGKLGAKLAKLKTWWTATRTWTKTP